MHTLSFVTISFNYAKTKAYENNEIQWSSEGSPYKTYIKLSNAVMHKITKFWYFIFIVMPKTCCFFLPDASYQEPTWQLVVTRCTGQQFPMNWEKDVPTPPAIHVTLYCLL